MVWIGGLKVNGVTASSSVGIGPKVISGSETHAKQTTGNASVRGDMAVAVTLWGAVGDSDVLDTPVWFVQGASDQGEEG